MGCEGLGYVKTKYNKDPGDVPDIEYIFVPMSLAGEEGLGNSLLRRSMGIPDSTHYDLHKGIFNKDGWTIWTMLMYPESTGQVRRTYYYYYELYAKSRMIIIPNNVCI